MKTGGVILLSILLSLCSFSLALYVEYVPNAACEQEAGCDFNGPIWNTTGTPSAEDDVVVVSNVPITIYAVNTDITLHGLWMGDYGTAGVTFILTNSALTVTGRSMGVGTATYLVPKANNISTLILNSSSLYCSSIAIDTIISNNATISGYYAKFLLSNTTDTTFNVDGNTYFYDSVFATSTLFNTPSVYFDGPITADACQFNFSSFFYDNYVAIANMEVPFQFTYFTINTNSVLKFENTQVIFDYLLHVNGTLIFESTDASKTLTIGAADGSYIHLGTGVSAFLERGYYNNISFDSPVNIHFGQFDVVASLYQASYNGIQSSVTANSSSLEYTVVYAISPVDANFEILGSSMTFRGPFPINGNVSGGQLKVLDTTSFSFVSVETVQFNTNSELTTSQLNSNGFQFYANNTNATVNSPSTFVTGDGLALDNNFLFFNGDYTQTGGSIKFAILSTTDAFLNVNGSLVLDGVTIIANPPTEIKDQISNPPAENNNQKWLLISSLSANVKIKTATNPEASVTFKITTEGGNVYLEIPDAKSPSTLIHFLKSHIYIPIIVGVVFIALIILGTFLVSRKFRRAKDRGYSKVSQVY